MASTCGWSAVAPTYCPLQPGRYCRVLYEVTFRRADTGVETGVLAHAALLRGNRAERLWAGGEPQRLAERAAALHQPGPGAHAAHLPALRAIVCVTASRIATTSRRGGSASSGRAARARISSGTSPPAAIGWPRGSERESNRSSRHPGHHALMDDAELDDAAALLRLLAGHDSARALPMAALIGVAAVSQEVNT